MKKTLAIIVTYNRKELLSECIHSLLNQTYKECNILVIDNASTDGTREYINKYVDNKKVIYENTGSNLGGAGGFNYGIKYALENLNYDYLWLMDDDTIPTQTALQELVSGAEVLKNNFGFLSSKVLWKDGKYCNMNIPIISKDWTNNIDLVSSEMIRLNSASFVSCFIKQETAYEMGLPIKDFFIWGDDVEYTSRISKKYNSYFVNKSVVIHKMKSNSPVYFVEDNDVNRIKRLFYTFRNRFYIRKKEGFVGIVKHCGMFFRDFNIALFKSKKYRLLRTWSILKGFLVGIFFNPKIEYVVKKDVKNGEK